MNNYGMSGIGFQKTKPIYLRKLSVSGIKGFHKKVNIDLTPTKLREFSDNLETWGLERSKYDFGALKSHIFLGENGSGKSSVLEAILSLNMFLSNPTFFQQQYLGTVINADILDNIMWEAEFVTKIGRDIVKIFYLLDLKIIGKERKIVNYMINEERLSYIKTQDGKTISDEKEIFKVERNLMVNPLIKTEFYGFNVANLNGIRMFLNGYIKLDGEIEQNIIRILGTLLKSQLNRDAFPTQVTINKHFQKDQTVENKKRWEFKLKLHQLFNKNIIDINFTDSGEILIKYQTAIGVKEITFNEYFARTSAGEKRGFELIEMIIAGKSSQEAISFYDEIDRSLHPKLSEFLYDFITFTSHGQTFFTTHQGRLTELAVRRDQIHLIKKTNDVIEIKKGTEIAPTKNHKFNNEYLEKEYLSTPTAKIREELYELV